MFFGWFLLHVWFGVFFKGFALMINQMLERIWFKVFMIARIDNLSFLASVKNISKSASWVCKLLPAGDSSQFAMWRTGLWQASSQHGNVVMWQQGYQTVSVPLHSVSRTSATVEMGCGVAGRARHPGKRGEEGNREEAGDGMRRVIREEDKEDSSAQIVRNWAWERTGVTGRKESLLPGWQRSLPSFRLHEGLSLSWRAPPRKGTDLLLWPSDMNRVPKSPQVILLTGEIMRADSVSDSSTQQHRELAPGHPQSSINSEP